MVGQFQCRFQLYRGSKYSHFYYHHQQQQQQISKCALIPCDNYSINIAIVKAITVGSEGVRSALLIRSNPPSTYFGVLRSLSGILHRGTVVLMQALLGLVYSLTSHMYCERTGGAHGGKSLRD